MTAVETRDGFCDILEAVAAAASGRSVRRLRQPERGDARRPPAGPDVPGEARRCASFGRRPRSASPTAPPGSATITAAPGFAVDRRDPSSACLVLVADGTPDVWLRDVTLTQDPGLDAVGRLRDTKGALDLRRVRVTGFGAGGIGATCLPASGCDHEADSGAATTLRVLGSSSTANHSAGKGAGISSEGSGAVDATSRTPRS